MIRIHAIERGAASWLRGTLAGLALTFLAACGATTKEKPKLEEGHCALIPPDICAKLKPTSSSDLGGLRYLRPNADWSKYKKVMIPPVIAFGSEKSKFTGEQQHALVSYAYDAISKAFDVDQELADVPGPDVVKLQMAITDAAESTPVLRSVSMGLPQARLIGTLKYFFTGTYPFVGWIQGEAVITDSVSGEILAAGVDRRAGGAAIGSAATWGWDDAERGINKWAEMLSTRFKAFTTGKEKP